MARDIALNLAENIRQLRETRGLTQDQASKLAQVPRPTWATLESGSSNPTLSVLVKISSALQVSIEELIGPPRSIGRIYRRDELRTRQRGGVTVRRLLPEQLAGLEIERMQLPPGTHMRGVPHTPGTREYLTCERGTVHLSAGGETFDLAPGDVVVFRGDQKHAYHNPGTRDAVAYSVVALAPIGG